MQGGKRLYFPLLALFFFCQWKWASCCIERRQLAAGDAGDHNKKGGRRKNHNKKGGRRKKHTLKKKKTKQQTGGTKGGDRRNNRLSHAADLSIKDICLPFKQNPIAQSCTSFEQSKCLSFGSCNISAPTFHFSPPVRYYNESHCGKVIPTEKDYQKRLFWESIASNLGLLAESGESACLTLLYMKPQYYLMKHNNQSPCRVSPRQLVEVQWGRRQGIAFINHLDPAPTWWPDLLGRPIQLASHMLACFYRPNYDVSIIPLFYDTHRKEKIEAYYNIHVGNPLPPDQRAFLLTLKASAYIEPRGASRLSLLELHDPANGVVIQLTCKPGRDQSKLCKNLYEAQEQNGFYDYDYLMNTTFALVPEGRSPASYRLNEALAAGAIPVFFGDTGNTYVRPFAGMLDWDAISLSFTTAKVNEILPTLMAIDSTTRLRMQALGQKVFRHYFRSNQVMAATIMTLLKRRVQAIRVSP